MKSRKFFAGLASAAMVLSMAACSSSDTSSSTDSTSTDDTSETSDTTDDSGSTSSSSGSSDGTLVVGTTQELAGIFSPMYYVSAYDAWVVNMIYQSMQAYDADSELYNVLLAEDPTTNDDGSVITFKLKEGIKFSDGSDLTADDVKFTFTLYADPAYKGQRNDGVYNFIEGWSDYQDGDAEEVSGIKVLDDYTVEFTVGTPNIDAQTTIATCSILSDTQYDYTKGDLGGYASDNDNPMGSGPYVLNTYDKSAGASLVKNENYTGDGEYKIERVVIKTIATATELASLQNGDINYLPETIEADIIGPASLDESLTYDYYFRAAEGYIGFNCADGPTAEPEVRQALCYAVDRSSFVDAFYAFPESSEAIADVGLGYVPTAFWSPVATDMGDYTTGAADLEGLVEYDFDIEKAKQILEDAGWVEGSTTDSNGNKIREKDGQILEIKFLASEGNSVLEMLMPMIIDSWGQIGVKLLQNTVDFNTLCDTVDISNTDVSGWSCFFMATSFTGLSSTTMNDLLGFSGSVDDPTYLGSNYVRIVDEDLNTYLTNGKETFDWDTSIDNYKKAMVRESELAPYLAMYGNHLFNIYTTNVHDIKTGPVCNWSQALAGAYID